MSAMVMVLAANMLDHPARIWRGASMIIRLVGKGEGAMKKMRTGDGIVNLLIVAGDREATSDNRRR